MSTELVVLLNTALRFILATGLEFDGVSALLKRAHSEGRTLTPEEVDEFAAQAHAAKAAAHAAAAEDPEVPLARTVEAARNTV